MKIRLVFSIILGFSLAAAVSSQSANPDLTSSQTSAQAQAQSHGGGDRQGQHGGWGERAGFGAGNGIIGTVTEVASDHYTIKTDTGQIYKVSFGVNTRILKQMPRKSGGSGDERGTAPQAIKSSAIKVGDAIMAAGEVDAAAKSVGAVVVMQTDPERARQFRELQANYDKTWLAGKVTAINETSVTLLGTVDSANHTFRADENTTFRKHREPITLADIQLGDVVRVEGAVKDGNFVATSVSVMGRPQGGNPAALSTPGPQPK
jgi:hypothetical protein